MHPLLSTLLLYLHTVAPQSSKHLAGSARFTRQTRSSAISTALADETTRPGGGNTPSLHGRTAQQLENKQRPPGVAADLTTSASRMEPLRSASGVSQGSPLWRIVNVLPNTTPSGNLVVTHALQPLQVLQSQRTMTLLLQGPQRRPQRPLLAHTAQRLETAQARAPEEPKQTGLVRPLQILQFFMCCFDHSPRCCTLCGMFSHCAVSNPSSGESVYLAAGFSPLGVL